MINELTTLIRLAAEAVLRIIAWPAEQILTYLAEYVPGIVETLALHPGNGLLLYAVALMSWLLVFLLLRGVVRFANNVLRMIERMKTFVRFRMSMAVKFGKRRVHILSSAFRIWRHPEEAETPHIEFGDQDIAVLDAIVARGPGFAVSAPELTEQLELRPSQVQRSLDKLCDSALLQSVIGSTDGYDNYSVTPIGEAFMHSWLRQTSPKAPPPKKKREPETTRDFIPDGLHLSG